MKKYIFYAWLLIAVGCVHPAIMYYETSWDEVPTNVEKAFIQKHEKAQVSKVEKAIFQQKIVSYYFTLKEGSQIKVTVDGRYIGESK